MYATKCISASILNCSDDTPHKDSLKLRPLPAHIKSTSSQFVATFMQSTEINNRHPGSSDSNRECSSARCAISTKPISFSGDDISWNTIPLQALSDELRVSRRSKIKVAWDILYRECVLLCAKYPLTTSGLLDAAGRVTYACFSPLNPWWGEIHPLVPGDTATILGFYPVSLLPVARDYILSLSAIDGITPSEKPIIPVHLNCVQAIVNDTSQLCWEILQYMQHQLLHIGLSRCNVKLGAYIQTGVEQAWTRTYRHICHSAPFMVIPDASHDHNHGSIVSLNYRHKQIVVTMNVLCRIKAVLDWFYIQYYRTGQDLIYECCVARSIVQDPLNNKRDDNTIFSDEYERLVCDYNSLSDMITGSVSRVRVQYTQIISALEERPVGTCNRVALHTKEHIWSETVARQLRAIGCSSHGWGCVDETCGCAHLSLYMVALESHTIIRAALCIASTIKILRLTQTPGTEIASDAHPLCNVAYVHAPCISIKLNEVGFIIPALLLPIKCESLTYDVLQSERGESRNFMPAKPACMDYYAWLAQVPSGTRMAQVEQQLTVTGDNLLTFVRPYIETMIRVAFTVYGLNPLQEIAYSQHLLFILSNMVRVNSPHQPVASYASKAGEGVSSIEMLSYIVYSNLLSAYTIRAG
jgi:hypothetical protein